MLMVPHFFLSVLTSSGAEENKGAFRDININMVIFHVRLYPELLEGIIDK